MIFDTPEMQKLRDRYAGQSLFHVPEIVHLDALDEYAGERAYLENLVASARQTKQRDWINRLVNSDDSQHMGAWFEIMLFGWLQALGAVEVAPQVEGNDPDFSVLIGSNRIIIEAHAQLMKAAEREREYTLAEIYHELFQVELPYKLAMDISQYEGSLDVGALVNRVLQWLNDGPRRDLRFTDARGNEIVFYAKMDKRRKRVWVSEITSAILSDASALKGPLRDKATQHSAIRKARHPYVLAFYLQPDQLSPEEVTEALFGRTAYIFGRDDTQTREIRSDRSGIHFFGSEIRYTSVSGTLVFESEWNEAARSRQIVAHYIQNPYARVPLDTDLFPVTDSFVVVGQESENHMMVWRKQQSS